MGFIPVIHVIPLLNEIFHNIQLITEMLFHSLCSQIVKAVSDQTLSEVLIWINFYQPGVFGDTFYAAII